MCVLLVIFTSDVFHNYTRYLIYYTPTNALLYCNSLKSLHKNTFINFDAFLYLSAMCVRVSTWDISSKFYYAYWSLPIHMPPDLILPSSNWTPTFLSPLWLAVQLRAGYVVWRHSWYFISWILYKASLRIDINSVYLAFILPRCALACIPWRFLFRTYIQIFF